MNITVDWKRYAEKSLKRMEKELNLAIKNKEDWKIEELKRDIEKHKKDYSKYLKKD